MYFFSVISRRGTLPNLLPLPSANQNGKEKETGPRSRHPRRWLRWSLLRQSLTQNALARDLSAKIGLVSDQNYMVFQPMLPEVVSGSLSPRHVVNPIRHLCKGLNVYKAAVEKIDIKNKTLTLRPGPFSPEVIIRFKHLVVALGAVIDLSRVPGMASIPTSCKTWATR